ncbi:MAG: SDR family NAD(P)-dependent oxidoreductase [Phycisphaerae bacterium]|nr:SDR family NAD(P)-dependent oxidoreductase [Phycisphaerae bacterium]
MRIIITGAAGFIGSHLCQRLLARGDEIIAIDNFDPFYDHRIKQQNLEDFIHHKQVRFFQKDICDTDAMEHLWLDECQELDAVVHLAAKAGVRPSIEDPVGYERANIMGTMNLLDLAVTAEVRPRFIFASSSSVYGNNPKVPFSETDNVDHPISPYAATKKAGELICHSYHHLYDLPVTALRFFTVYGPRQRPDLAIRKFTELIMRDEPIPVFGDGTTSRDYTYIDDIIDGVTAAIDRCEGYEIINLGGKHPISLTDMIATLEKAIGKTAIIDRQPMQAGDVERTFANVEKASRLLGYEPKMPFEQGIKQFVDWWKTVNG